MLRKCQLRIHETVKVSKSAKTAIWLQIREDYPVCSPFRSPLAGPSGDFQQGFRAPGKATGGIPGFLWFPSGRNVFLMATQGIIELAMV